MSKTMKFLRILCCFFITFSILSSCGIYRPVDARKQPQQAKDKARKNIEEGRGVSLKGMIGNKATNYEFSSSNPMWRASLEIIDFLPLTTVDYSGGVIITDWYNDSQSPDESIKITIRFLSNEVKSNSLKIIVHNKKCSANKNCRITTRDSKIKEELRTSIIKRAARLKAEIKKNKIKQIKMERLNFQLIEKNGNQFLKKINYIKQKKTKNSIVLKCSLPFR